MAVLVFDHVAKAFGANPVLRSVSLVLDAPRVVGLIGDNGAGKTTFIRLAVGLLTPSAGTIRLFDAPASHDSAALMQRVGALIESPGHYDELTVRENLQFALAFYNDRAPLGTLDAVTAGQLAAFGLTEVAERSAGQLSSGFRQRLALARAIHPWADAVFLDEPFVNLDPGLRVHLKGVLDQLRRGGKLVVLSSHTLTDIEQLCDEVILLANGMPYRFDDFATIRRLVGSEPPDDLDQVYERLQATLAPRAPAS
jgi:ABC-type multidrug transport system ATPase subunit